MNLKYLLCIFYFLILRGISFSQENFDSNIEVVNRLVDESFISLGNKLTITGKDKFYSVNYDKGSESASYIFNRFKERFYDYKLIINENPDSIDYVITFGNTKITTKYKDYITDNALGVKKLVREISVSCSLEMKDKRSSQILLNQNFNKKSKDNIDLDKLSNAEDNRFSFSSSELPEESTLNQIIFPSIIIAASAAAIILFFTIRSK